MRGYLAGLGTMGVQVVGALVLLAVVSGLLVFDGGLGRPGEREPGTLDEGGIERVAREAAPAAAAVAEEPARGSRARALPAARAAMLGPVDARGARADVAMTGEGGQEGGPGTLINLFSGPPPPSRARCLLRMPVEEALRCPLESLDAAEASLARSLVTGLNDTTARLNATTAELTDATTQITAGAAHSVGKLDPRLGRTISDTSSKLCLDGCAGASAGTGER